MLLKKLFQLIAFLVITSSPVIAQEAFISRLKDLSADRQKLFVSAARGIWPTDATEIPLSEEMEVGATDAPRTLLLYVDIACEKCVAAVRAMSSRLRNDDFAKRNRVVYRLTGGLLDSTVTGCLARGDGNLFAGIFEVASTQKPDQWSLDAIGDLRSLTGLGGEPEACLDTGLLERSFAHFKDLLSSCDALKCVRSEARIDGELQPVLLPMTPVLFVGPMIRQGTAMEIETTVLGVDDISAYIAGI